MLRTLHILDYAIIESVELALEPGMSVLTGETGAGKSILVDALGLVLGDRADSGAVRHGAERAEITAEFELAGLPDTRAWLEDNDLADDGACILRRVAGADGRSRGYINGRPAPLTLMRELGEQLVDIHGQHEHQSLLRRDMQLQLLDDHGGHGALRDDTAALYDAWHAADLAWRELHEAVADREARVELLRFQVAELEALGLGEGEIATLEAEHARLANSNRLLEAARTALGACDADDGSPNARGLLHAAVTALEPVAPIDPRLKEIQGMLQQSLINAGEAAGDLNHWLESFELDPARLDAVETRLGTAQQLARKHRVTAPELPVLLDRLRGELDGLDHADEKLAALVQERERLAGEYRDSARSLSAARGRTAEHLAGDVTAAMQELGMPGGELAITLHSDAERFARNGIDTAEITVTANPGQPLRPLVKVASGGELSRISLAIQVTAAKAARIPCMIFDEVDAGIGGGVAEIVGRQLRQVARGRQVLCVTHLAQVASQAHAHFRVVKQPAGETTRTVIEVLGGDQRIDELARMLGGVKITEKTRATAREMLE